MKVCFFIDNIANTGGTERVTSLIANCLISRNVEVSILSLWGNNISGFDLDPAIRLQSLNVNKNKFKYKITSTISGIRKFVKKHEFDYVITVESILSFFTIPAITFLKTKNIVWEHFNFNTDLGLKVRRFSRKLSSRFAHTIVVLTERDRELWQSNLKCSAVIKSILNPLSFPIQNNQLPTTKTVMSVGRLTFQKGFDLLINAWKLVALDNADWKLKIIGSGEDQEILKKLILDNGMSDFIEMIPKTNKIEDFYKNSEILCLSSRFEGLPMVLLESQAFGLPVVSFDCETGPSEIIINGVNGLLCAPEDIEALADGLNTLIGSRNLRESMSINAFKNADRFSIEHITDQWMNLLIGHV